MYINCCSLCFFNFFFAKLVTKNCFIFTKTYTFLYFLNIREFLFYFEKKNMNATYNNMQKENFRKIYSPLFRFM